MPQFDLSLEGAHDYWSHYADPTIYRVVAFMESVENWTLDGDPDFEKAIASLSKTLSEASRYELGEEESLIKIACYLKMTRTLYLLQAIDSIQPGSASKLLMYAEEKAQTSSKEYNLFLRRNIVFERLRLLARVFSKDRFNFVMKALEKE